MSTYEQARKRAVAKFGLYIHAAVFLGVNIFLIILNLAIDRQNIWFIWPLLGWGIGLAAHWVIFALSNRPGQSVLDKFVERELQKEQIKSPE
ncbi:MAG: 2TM domain-containing protein [Methyloligellaceae bacterium]